MTIDVRKNKLYFETSYAKIISLIFEKRCIMSFVHVCPKCKGVFKYPSVDFRDCPECRVPLISTYFSDAEWAALSPAEKSSLKNDGTSEILKKKKLMEEERERDLQISKILVSSGFNFDGYRIVKYSGYISGDDAVQIPRSGAFGGNNGQNLTDALVKIRRQALKELKEAAYSLGCNAVIGVDFDYITLEPETANNRGGTLYEPYIICVTANGNAVVIEKE